MVSLPEWDQPWLSGQSTSSTAFPMSRPSPQPSSSSPTTCRTEPTPTHGVVFAVLFLIIPFTFLKLPLNQTTLSLFACVFIGSMDIYWTTTWGFEDIKIKGNIYDLKGLPDPPLPHSGLLTFLSSLPRMISTSSTLSLTSVWILLKNLHIPVPC